jgi:hypothetical protein
VPAAAVDDAIGLLGELAELLRREGADVGAGAEGESIARSSPEVVGKLVTLAEVAGWLVGGHLDLLRVAATSLAASWSPGWFGGAIGWSSLSGSPFLNDDLDSELCLP